MAAPEAYPILSTSMADDDVGSARRRAKFDSQAHSPLLTSLSHAGGHAHARPGRPAKQSKLSKRRRESRGLPLFRRSWALPLVLMIAFVSLYALNPTESNIISHFLFLSYRVDNGAGESGLPVQYGKGLWDIAFVCFYTIFLSFTREFIMQEILKPLGRSCGIKSQGKQLRFAEQVYTACYILFIGPLGLYTMKQTPGLWYFETRGMYEGFPHKTHAAVFKFYYLFQAAFWVQQSIVMLLGQEKPRKDFKELIAHHIITIALIGLSYRFHFAYIGIAVYVTHDISDFFLAISKSLNYIDVNDTLQGQLFGLCIVVWIYLRHYINLRILYSVATEYSIVGPFELNWETGQYKSRLSQVITFGLLAFLQALNLFWLFYLFRIAYRYVFLGIAKDSRSEGEESEIEEAAPATAKAANGRPKAAAAPAVKANGAA